jgi:hypothetical protein
MERIVDAAMDLVEKGEGHKDDYPIVLEAAKALRAEVLAFNEQTWVLPEIGGTLNAIH